MDREQLETFATIVEVQSFERAANQLNISRGAVSQRIKALEESLATVLLVREKPVVPTARGQVLMRHVQSLRLLESATLKELMPSADQGPVPLAVAVNVDSLATWFPAAIWPLLHEREVAIELIAEDQDHTLDRLSKGDVVGCISTNSEASLGFIAQPLGCMEYRCYATRDFASRFFPNGITVHEALMAPAILFNRKDSLHDTFLSTLFGFRIEKYVKHYLPGPTTLLDGISAGVGYGLIPSVQVVERYAGQLIDLAPSHPVDVALYWHRWSTETPQVRRISDRIIRAAAAALKLPTT